MEQRLPRRRKMRLPEYDYSSAGYYFITICTKDKRCFFGKIVGRADPGAPHPQPASPEKAMRLTAPQFQPTPIGKIVEKYIQSIDQAYSSVSLDQYVIMPNHIHMILRVAYPEDGAPGSSRPTQTSDAIGWPSHLAI